MAGNITDLLLVHHGVPEDVDYRQDPGLRTKSEDLDLLRGAANRIIESARADRLKQVQLVSGNARWVTESAIVIAAAVSRSLTIVGRETLESLSESSDWTSRDGTEGALDRLHSVMHFEADLDPAGKISDDTLFVAVTEAPIIRALADFHGVAPDLDYGGVTHLSRKFR